ncbi:MAG: methyltransferase domain-containing protein [Chloroflexi bacterium]|nr:MAG: methyltransferase domain-containing protein [Chloroflexota bacterium]
MNKSQQLNTRDTANQVFFDEWSKNYDGFRLSKWFQFTQKLATSVMDIKPDNRVLDVGCGTGYAVIEIARRLDQGKAYGIDISTGMVERAIKNIPGELSNRVSFRQASAEYIPYPNSDFDYILCTNSFHHYPEPPRALREMYRVLRPGGLLVILDNAIDLSLYTWAWDRLLRLFEKGHVRYYTTKELGEMISKAGFKDVSLRYGKNSFMKHGKLFASLQVWSGRKPDS